MRTIKPLRLAVLPRCYENGGRCHLAVTVVFFFPFDPPDLLLPEMSLWKLVAEEMGTDMPLDECMPKKHPEVLVFGSAFATAGKEQPACKVRVAIGGVDKSLLAIGDRQWERGGAPSEPKPFTSLPISWANAFGGAGFARNPAGKGAAPVTDEAGNKSHPLANIEAPNARVSSPRDKPEPAGFGAYPLDWPQRMAKAGTYDANWLKELFPGYARDMDWSFFNVAPPDQWLAAPMRGDEPFVLENMHPERLKIESRLPGVKARCFVNQRGREGTAFREVETRLDTVMLFPHRLRGLVFWRGVIEIAEDDGADIEAILAAAEPLDEARPASHYQRAIEQRSNEKTRHLFALKDGDLLPSQWMRPSGLPDEKLSDIENLLAREGLLEKNLRTRMELDLAKVREDLVRAGIDPDAKGVPQRLPEPEPVPTFDEMPEFHARMTAVMEQAIADTTSKRAAAEAELKSKCAALGIDYQQAVDKAERDAAGPPKFKAAEELARLRDRFQLSQNSGVPLPEVSAKLADPELEGKLALAEKTMLDSYRRHAHFQPAVGALGGDDLARMRERVAGDRREGKSLARVDLTGANLAEMDLGGIDLREALLESVDLSGANLTAANLTGACLARANLSGANIAGAVFRDANLGQARFAGVRGADGVDFGNANFSGADLTRADLSGANLTGATLLDLILGETRLERIRGEKLIFMKTNLTGVSFAGAVIPSSVFLECDASDADFSGAVLREVAFVATVARKARFCGADVTSLRAVKETDFSDADFSGASGERANFRGCVLARANFERARLDRSDFSSCDARETNFSGLRAIASLFIRTDLRRAKLTRANLMQALLQKANIGGADFTGANLFRADFSRIDGDEATKFDRANMNHMRFVRRPGSVG